MRLPEGKTGGELVVATPDSSGLTMEIGTQDRNCNPHRIRLIETAQTRYHHHC